MAHFDVATIRFHWTGHERRLKGQTIELEGGILELLLTDETRRLVQDVRAAATIWTSRYSGSSQAE